MQMWRGEARSGNEEVERLGGGTLQAERYDCGCSPIESEMGETTAMPFQREKLR